LSDVGRDGKAVELVAILLGRDRILSVLEEAATMGVKAAWAFASGFAEANGQGEKLQRRLENFCRENQLAFCGPNCVGFLNPTASVGTYSAPLSPSLAPGKIGAVVQSGSICLGLANSDRGLGYSLLISSGNEAVLDSTDYISYMLEDNNTDVILAFIEQFRRPDRLIDVACRARQVEKPLIVLKVGRSELAKQAAVTHTGALTGADAVYDAVFKKYGIIRVDSLDEMLETAAALAGLKDNLPAGNQVGMITVSGGEIGLIGDLTEGLDVDFPDWSTEATQIFQEALPPYSNISNPLDAWGNGKVEGTYPPSMTAAAAEENIDLVVISQDSPAGMAPAQVDQYAIVAKAAVDIAGKSGKPIVAVSNLSGGLHPGLRRIFEDGGVPLLQGTQEGLRAVHHLITYGNIMKKGAFFRPDSEKRNQNALTGRREGILMEDEAKRFLSQNGISCVQEVLCHNLDEAVDAYRKIGRPVALKLISPEIPHKTDAGIVRLNIVREEDLRNAYQGIMENAGRYMPDANITGVLVQEMITAAVAEVIVGISKDADFGPIVLFGLGGTTAELFEDHVLSIPPLSREEAIEMIHRTKASRLLQGFRGKPAGDEPALVDVLVRLGGLANEWADRIQALDINPLLVLPAGQGVVAVDALIQIESDDSD
jgi:acyl-CoA synthetase (NDP forming)